MARYYTYTVKKVVTVQHLVTIEYLDVDADFFFPKESHDFYEFVYVESGKITCKTEERMIPLTGGDLFLIAPGTFHTYFVEQEKAASIIIVCFKSKSTFLSTAVGVHHLEEDLLQLVKKILGEAKKTFVFPFDEKLTLMPNPRLGSQQLIENYIEEMIIKLVQKETYQQSDIQIVTSSTDRQASIVADVKKMLRDHLYSGITLSEISHRMLYSKTYLNDLFKSHTGSTIMQYYLDSKIKEAKKMLAKQEPIAVVAEKLGFESPQHFAKTFKKKTGQTATEFKRSMRMS